MYKGIIKPTLYITSRDLAANKSKTSSPRIFGESRRYNMYIYHFRHLRNE